MKKVSLCLLLIALTFANTVILHGQTKKNTKSDPNIPIFEIKNDLGQTVFAVYPGGVKIFIDEQLKAAGGGFTVGRLGTGKATADDFFIVNPGDVRVNLPEPVGKVAGGGFTVGRLGTGKATGDLNFMSVTPDSTRIYTVETSNKGFAVGKLSTELGSENFLDLTPDNYFIGHESGVHTTGLYNLFLGYRTGYVNTSGFYNVFIGRESGYSNTVGQRNIFIGDRAGYNNIGSLSGAPPTIGHDNIYIGTFAGRDNINGEHNTLVGSYSGYTSTGTKNTFFGAFTGFASSGTANVFLGVDAGRNNTAGNNNTFLGTIAGNNNSGSNNTFVGYGSGYYNKIGNGNVFLGYLAGPNDTSTTNKLYIDNSTTSSPLIYGDFDLNRLAFNGNVGVNRTPYSSVSLSVSPSGLAYGIWVDAGSTLYAAYFNGDAYTTGLWSSSDVRWKRNITTISSALDKVVKLRGVTYEWDIKKYPANGFEEGIQIGLIAQEVEKLFPELIKENQDGYKAVAYNKLTAVLVEAIKEQQAEIEKLKKHDEQIEQLKKENAELKSQLSKIKNLESEIKELRKLTDEFLNK